EIEMPGHSGAAVTAYPQYECNCSACTNAPFSQDVTNAVFGRGGIFCPARPETFTFLQDILTEVMGLFPGPYIHIGGDEVNFNNWRNHSLDQAMTNRLGVNSMQRYQGDLKTTMAITIKNQGVK